MARESRLTRRVEEQSKKNTILSIFGILVIIGVLVKFGLPLLTGFTSLLVGSKSSQAQISKNDVSYVAPPTLDPLYNATNSAQITISGIASQDQIISLYVNKKLIDKTKAKKDNTFEFHDVNLVKGNNSIKAKATIEDSSLNEKKTKESDFSTEQMIVYKNEEPALTVDSPTDGQSFSKDESTITVKGKTDSGNRVTINDFWAIVDEEGNFSYQLKLHDGENSIKVVATDDAGNKKEIEKKVTYSP